MKKILIKNGRIIDPASQIDEVKDLYIEGKHIKAMGDSLTLEADEIIDATGHWVVPGLIDVHVHLREPGFTHKETILSGGLSAAAGGFTTICCMPNTNPVIDSPQVVKEIQEKAQRAPVKILPIASITKGQLGEELVDYGALVPLGICGLSEDGKTVMNSSLMKRALERAKEYNLPVMAHCEDHYLAAGGVMNEGALARALGLRGIPPEAEDVITCRDTHLALHAGARLHLCHISTRGAVGLLRGAKQLSSLITGEVTPHHFTLTEEAVRGLDPNTKVNPPLRSQADVKEILKALQDGTIEIIATDHAPHHPDEKAQGFEKAPFGIVGLETALALGITELVERGILTPMALIEKMSTNPARLLNIAGGTLKAGSPADITLIDPRAEYEIDSSRFYSKARNTPFQGRRVRGRVCYTLVDGSIVFQNTGLRA